MKTMRKLLVVSLVLIASTGIVRAGELIWCGLDYSSVKLVGDTDVTPSSLPGMVESWNALFIKEQLSKLEKMAGVVRVDTEAAQASSRKVSEKNFHATEADAPAITDKDIATLVKGYKLQAKEGLGLVFVMDTLVKRDKTGNSCMHVVFFDVASRQVISAARQCEKASGIGPRNFWFGAVKKVVKNLPSAYKKASSSK